ncbi:pentatricopeptide repeat-containing protein At3g29230-like [Magnolia sinica]|uniref:pentatricopeptide repeat-containing protein At3g29230-like n=1 Tax=Magnolia sinica TaxID=86752 RepID=UPI00265AB2CB|nr:pentatricopeptide repeat-containing protein At3g29230-like [Magnolia sinica]
MVEINLKIDLHTPLKTQAPALRPFQMSGVGVRPPSWISHRRLLEQKLSDLQKRTDINRLKQVQAQIFKANLHQDPFIAPKLVSAFSLCRQMPLAIHVFRQIQEPNVLLYNTLIRAFTHNSLHGPAFSVFFEMQRKGVWPDNFTYPFLLKACVGQFALRQVHMIHAQIVKSGFESDIFVPNALIDSYCKCRGGVGDSKKVFDKMPERDVVSWNSMITGLVKSGEMCEARRLFDEMPERDTVSWNAVLDGYAKAGEMDVAFELFEKMPERNVVSWSTMTSGYSKAGDMDMARLLFDKMPVKNLVPWTIMISGYAEKGLGKEASRLYDQMGKAGLKPDDATIISILSACAESGFLGLGKRIHAYVDGTKLKYSTQVCNALVDMYAKCGILNKAMRVFDGIVEKDVVSWNSMVQGLAMHGCGEKALELFSRMKRDGAAPDGITFVGIICACTHVGLIDEARRYFSRMERDYGVVPQIEHYGCMVDLLGRGGHLNEAFELVKSMPMEPNAIIWGTLLGSCRMHNNVALAERVIDHLVELEPSNAGNYAILSNIYAAAGHWDDVAKVRLQMKDTGVQKPAGSSSIQVDDVVHEFTVSDRSHPQSYRIYKMIDRLGQHLKHIGYVPKAHC